jgi:hypothetical protein
VKALSSSPSTTKKKKKKATQRQEKYSPIFLVNRCAKVLKEFTPGIQGWFISKSPVKHTGGCATCPASFISATERLRQED